MKETENRSEIKEIYGYEVIHPFGEKEIEEFLAKKKENFPKILFKEYKLNGERIVIGLETLDSFKNPREFATIENNGFAPFGEVSRKITVGPDGTEIEGNGYILDVRMPFREKTKERELYSVYVKNKDESVEVVGRISTHGAETFSFGHILQDGILVPQDVASNLSFYFTQDTK
jgi:hypothetical protein